MASKSGWLYKTSGLNGKCWKKKYCVLYEDGKFEIFLGANKTSKNKQILLTRVCKRIQTGTECYKWNSIVLPKDVQGLECLFSMEIRKYRVKKTYTFAAANEEERDEWVREIGKILYTSVLFGGAIGGIPKRLTGNEGTA